MQEQRQDDSTLSAAPMRFVLSCASYGAHLCCPVCGTELVHIAGVDVVQGNLLTTITGNRVNAANVGDPGHRGSIVRLAFWCEHGWHRFAYSFAFQKGNTVVELETGQERDVESLDELWRD